MRESDAQDRVVLGRVHGLFGVRGWIKLYSYTAPPKNILDYSHWELFLDNEWQRMRVVSARSQGKGLVAQLAGADDLPITERDAAAQWLEADIAVLRSELPALSPGEYYGAQLIGLRVFTQNSNELGRVVDFMDTGANPVMVVRGDREYLIPFIREMVILNVDLSAGAIDVDWDPEF